MIWVGWQKKFTYIPLHAPPRTGVTAQELNNLVSIYDWSSKRFRHTWVRKCWTSWWMWSTPIVQWSIKMARQHYHN